MSLLTYKLLHILGILFTFTAVGGVCMHVANGGDKASNRSRAASSALHGVGLLITLVAGFGLLARIGGGFPGWVIAKLVIWLLLGAALMIPYRSPALAKPMLWALPLLGALAAYLALYKPF